MSWFDKLIPPKIKDVASVGTRRGVPQGLWRKCAQCNAVLYGADLDRGLQVCPKCGHHMRLSARARLTGFFDQGSFEEMDPRLKSVDPLRFRDAKRYRDRLVEAHKDSEESEALLTAQGSVRAIPVVATAFEFRFLGGSMGSVVGEKFTRAVDVAVENRTPFVCFSASGGARMQEGLFSLMQMAKTAGALNRLRNAAIPYISVLTDPTMGGVSASLAMLGDVILAEPHALIGFAGPRVIEQTVRETLPEGFQQSEFLLAHGAIDMVVERNQLRDVISQALETLGFGPVVVPEAELVFPETEPSS
ncbi:MAG TPA: acetyl-CoA carboxylase, carboxyltransferase subunit beta [Arenicellales bacterium]|nr:acetyl-CoA carboxylase, carboxyltransferase subunit beta [Arenicellales bacterium]